MVQSDAAEDNAFLREEFGGSFALYIMLETIQRVDVVLGRHFLAGPVSMAISIIISREISQFLDSSGFFFGWRSVASVLFHDFPWRCRSIIEDCYWSLVWSREMEESLKRFEKIFGSSQSYQYQIFLKCLDFRTFGIFSTLEPFEVQNFLEFQNPLKFRTFGISEFFKLLNCLDFRTFGTSEFFKLLNCLNFKIFWTLESQNLLNIRNFELLELQNFLNFWTVWISEPFEVQNFRNFRIS